MTHFSMNIPCSMLCKEMLFKIALGRFWRAWLSQSPGKHGKLCIGPKGPNELSVPPFLNQSPAGPLLPGYSNASQKPLGSGNRSLNRQWDVKTRTPYLFWKSSQIGDIKLSSVHCKYTVTGPWWKAGTVATLITVPRTMAPWESHKELPLRT